MALQSHAGRVLTLSHTIRNGGNMKRTKTILAALALAGAGFGANAYAADISTTGVIDLSSGTSAYSRDFTSAVAGDTFNDKWSFTATETWNLGGGVLSFAAPMFDGLDITGLTLFNSAGFSLAGTKISGGLTDVWSINVSNMVADNYYLQVSGSILSNVASTYAGNLSVAAAVPEPATYGMLLGGLGLVGFMASRRKRKS